MRNIVSLIVGFLFALGLGISGMTDTTIVKGFLDVFGSWNLSLIAVMGSAVLIHTVSYHLIKQKSSPLLDTKFYLPTNKILDRKLILGASVFGIGWGWAGICPGPGIVSLVSGRLEIFIFIVAMIVGMYLFKIVEKKI